MSTHGPGRGWKVVSVVVPGMLFTLLGSGALSRSVEGFAWALVAYVVVLIGLVASEFRRWITRGYFARGELLPVLVAGGFAEALIAGALLADVLVERDPLALVVSVPVLLGLLSACDLMIAAKIGASEPPATTEPHLEEDGVEDDDEASEGEWLQDDQEAPAAVDPPSESAEAHQASASGRCLEVVVDLGTLAVRGAEWITPVAVLGVFGVCIAVAIGGVPKGASTSTIGGPQKAVPRAATESKPGGSGSGGSGGSGSSGGSGTGEDNPTPWNGPCTEEGRGKVSKLAFERMVNLFDEVHLEVSAKGCIADLEGHGSGPGDYYVTAAGIEQPSKEPLAYAVQGERCGGALVLNAARKAVEEVMAAAGPVCGVGPYPRYFLKKANYYFLRTAKGVYFVYERSGGGGYELVPPGLVRSWYHAMLAVNVWLYPSPPRQIGAHLLSYEMWAARNPERPELTITFNTVTGAGSYPQQSFPADPTFEPLLSKLLKLAESS